MTEFLHNFNPVIQALFGATFTWVMTALIVEPVAGIAGAATVLVSQAILPYALSFAAGAMIFVVIEDIIPEAHSRGNIDAWQR